MGSIKRGATYIPYAQRIELEKLSKADLMEIAYSLAVIQTGEEDKCEAYQIVKREHENMCLAQGRKPLKLAGGVQPLAQQEYYTDRVNKGTAPDWMVRQLRAGGWSE